MIMWLFIVGEGHFQLLLHAPGTVHQYTSLQHHLYRISEEEAQAVFVQSQLPILSFFFNTVVTLFSA